MFNKVILVGNCTRDIELRYSQGGMAIAKTGLATNRRFKRQSGEQVDETMFIDITFFGRSAEVANQYLRKGSKVLVEGRLMLEQWQDQNGNKRSKHSINVDNMTMLDTRAESQALQQQGGGYNAPGSNTPGGYDAPQPGQGGGYDAPMGENAYTPPPAQGGYQPPQPPQPATPKPQTPNQNIPEIDIDEDEIPF